MPRLNSLIQYVCSAIAAIPMHVTKKMYRNAAVICVGITVLSVLSFTDTGFGAGGKTAVTPGGEGTDKEIIPEGLPDPDLYGIMNLDLGIQSNAYTLGQQIVGRQIASEAVLKRANDDLIRTNAKIAREEVNAARLASQKEMEEQRLAEKKAERMAVFASQMGIPSFDDADYNNLLHIVQAEAGVCDMQGKIMVGNVIINRVKDSEFPNNVTDVILANGQFSPVGDGTFYTCKVSEETIKAVDEVLAGKDVSQGALFFMNRNGSRNHNVAWFDQNLSFICSYGPHEFYK